MRAQLILLTTLLTASALSANTITDPYPGTVCGDASCDVIGLTGPSSFAGWTIGGARYDVESVGLTTSPGTAPGSVDLRFTLRFNYDNGTLNGDGSFPSFPNSTGTAMLNPGDLLFRLGPTGNFLWGIPLTSHDGYTPGHLYGNGSNIGTQTADQVLSDSANTNYRFTWPVWMAPGLADNGGFVSITNTVLGGGPEVQSIILINLSSSTAFVSAINSGQVFASFTSATCANDVLLGPITGGQSDVPNVPEPVSSTLFGGGLLALAALGRKQLKKQFGK